MWQRVQSGGSGGGVIPFSLEAVSNRAVINSQNCYLWNDNGTPKMHFEINVSLPSSVSANVAFLAKMIPFESAGVAQKNVLPDGLYIYGLNSESKLTIACTSSRSSGYVYNCNTDITLSYT